MILQVTFIVVTVAVALLLAAVVFTVRATRWGARKEERAAALPGDAYLDDPARSRAVMTRAITIAAPVETVWPWLAQLGRGAGWYSYDFLDNGAKMSARHIVSWIPPAREGDASPIGYLRRIEAGSGLTWWVPQTRFLGSDVRLVCDIRLAPDGDESRLVIRMSCDAKGGFPRGVLAFFRFIDSVMARRQLLGIKDRVERHGDRSDNPEEPETGEVDQYQLYEVIYASGERAGVPGKERADECRRAAVEAGLATAADGEVEKQRGQG